MSLCYHGWWAWSSTGPAAGAGWWRGRAQVQQPALGGGVAEHGFSSLPYVVINLKAQLARTMGCSADCVLAYSADCVLACSADCVLLCSADCVLSRVIRELSSTNRTIRDGTVQALVCVCGFALCCPRTERLYLNRGCTVA